jgi:ADP-L-glycero-D-manno-heptose 6-epimerase
MQSEIYTIQKLIVQFCFYPHFAMVHDMKMFADKYIVVTGGAGFIGSCVIRMLNDRGMKNIIVVDRLGSSEKWKNLVGKNFLDILEKDSLFSWLEGKQRDIEAFIHLGACTSTIETDASYLLENNYRYSVRLAEYALEHGHRFIYASSAATYGDGSLGFSDHHETLEILEPLNMYGYSKHLFDLWLKNQKLLDKVVGLKYFNVYGPNESHKGRMASVILKMVPDALNTGKIFLFKSSEPEKFPDGGQVRDFIYVKDVAAMTLQFLESDVNGIFNIGTGKEQTWKELAESVMLALELPISIEYIDMPKDLLGKYQNYTRADMAKSMQHQLFTPEFSLEEGVRDYVCSYLLPQKRW